MNARHGQTSYRDRTQEFIKTIENLKKSSSTPDAPSSNAVSRLEVPKSAVSIQSEFSRRASQIGLGIHQTSQKLTNLAKLAKRTSVFDDPTVEIQELTAVIKQDITALNSSVVDLQHLCDSQNKGGNMSRDTTNHSTTVVDNLKNRLMSTTKEFKEVLTMRTENLKVHENRRQLFSSSASKDATNPFLRQRPLVSKGSNDSSPLAPPAPWENSSTSSSPLFPRRKTNEDPSSSTQPLIQQQQQQQQIVPVQDSYMQSRAEALQNVESTIHELSNIFTQLATMVSQQGELAIRIDENMDDTLANVEGAQGALLRSKVQVKWELGIVGSSENTLHTVIAPSLSRVEKITVENLDQSGDYCGGKVGLDCGTGLSVDCGSYRWGIWLASSFPVQMEISLERAEASDIPKKPRSLDLQSIYVKKSSSSDIKSWAGREVSRLEQESQVPKKKLGSSLDEVGELLSESTRKPSRKEVSLSNLQPDSKRQRGSLNVSRPKRNYISTSGSDATHDLDGSNGNAQYLGSDLYSPLPNKTDHESPSGVTSKNKSYFGEDLFIPKRPRDDSGDSVEVSQDDDEENLEVDAARMLSSRFDPSCTGFSGKRTTCMVEPAEGLTYLQSDHAMLKVSQAEACSVDATGRVLRPRRHIGKSFARKRRHFYEVCSRDMDPYYIVKQRIRVFWPLDKNWYFGLVKGYDPVTRLHHVKYDDRDEEWINLQKERFKLLLFPSEVSSKFNFGKQGSESRQNNTEGEPEAMESSYIGSLLESEPIISWLSRTTRRVTSSPSSTIKKHLRVSPLKDISPMLLDSKESMSMNPLDKNPNKLFFNCNESEQSRDQNFNRFSELKRSVDSECRKLPYVYFRKRFRSKRDVLDTRVVHGAAPGGPGGSVSIHASVANSRAAAEELNMIVTWKEFKVVIFKLNLPPQCTLELAFQRESLWLCQALYIMHHGELVHAWPVVRMEIFFIDTVPGLRFLLFEGSLKRAVSLLCLIITTVSGHVVKSDFAEPESPCSSIGLRISSLHNLGRKLLFVLSTVSKIESSKWRYLEDKLKKLFAKEALSTAEYMCSNIQNLASSQILSSSIKSIKRFWGRSNLVHRFNLKKLVDPNVNSVIHYLAQDQKKPLLCSLYFAAAPSFSLGLHLKLLNEKDTASLCSGDFNIVSSQNYADNTDKLTDDGHTSLEDPFKHAPEKIDNLRSSLSEAEATHGRPSLDALSAGSNSDLNRVTKNFFTSEDNVIQHAVDSSAVGKSFSGEGVVQYGRFQCEDGTSQFAEDTCSECPEHSSFTDKSLAGGCSSLVKTADVEGQLFDEVEKHSLHKGLLSSDSTSNLVLDLNEHTIHSPTAPRSMWHRNRHTSLSRTFIHHPRLGSKDVVENAFTSGYKRPRTQVSYSQLSGSYGHAAKSRSNHQKVQSHKKVKTVIANVSSNCSRSHQSYLCSLACDANVLVTHGDKCWREFGAKVQLDCDDQKNWRICIKVSGAIKYVYKAHHVLQPGTTNRYTHAMMWKGGKEWMLEFTDRNQWYIFKQMHEECYNQNIRAASVKNIPIPGVRLLPNGDDGCVEVPFVRSSSKYFRQVGTEADLALDSSHVLYDMDSEDEDWISTVRANMDSKDSKMTEVTDDMFERVMDMLEKFAYTQQCEEITNDDIEKYMADDGPADTIKVIYEHWRQKRKKKGRKMDGISVGEVAISSYESSDSYHGPQSRSTFSPRDTASTESFFTNDGSEKCPDPKFYRSTSKKFDPFLSPRDPQGSPFSGNQRSNRNGLNRWSSELCEWSTTRQSQSTGFHRHHADMDEFRLRDATSAAQHALNMAKLKREKAQWLLHKADLALHRATVALMTAEAIKASEKDIVGDG
ncbi:hypothetical protein C4D60_Mb10t03160 [Musa balbisiana]|uniref:Enhancer of polycomb-like protein n=1 Tax=Musa balbisiana TaxID=52838 RepID=A0A4S8IUA0_MUSBA|nr:hypothetical protein C4D60_Mb10t03160 [Musa balbisiana]